MTLHSNDSDQTFNWGKLLGQRLQNGDLLALQGGIGSGKTTLAQGIGAGLGVYQPLVSPTFPIILHYQGNLPLVHMDLYRLHSLEEFLLLDGEKFLYQQSGVCLIEWSQLISELLPPKSITINIRCVAEERLIEISALAAASRFAAVPRAL